MSCVMRWSGEGAETGARAKMAYLRVLLRELLTLPRLELSVETPALAEGKAMVVVEVVLLVEVVLEEAFVVLVEVVLVLVVVVVDEVIVVVVEEVLEEVDAEPQFE